MKIVVEVSPEELAQMKLDQIGLSEQLYECIDGRGIMVDGKSTDFVGYDIEIKVSTD